MRQCEVWHPSKKAPKIIVVGAAVANAIFGAVGARVLHMPMTADRVKAAMPKARAGACGGLRVPLNTNSQQAHS